MTNPSRTTNSGQTKCSNSDNCTTYKFNVFQVQNELQNYQIKWKFISILFKTFSNLPNISLAHLSPAPKKKTVYVFFNFNLFDTILLIFIILVFLFLKTNTQMNVNFNNKISRGLIQSSVWSINLFSMLSQDLVR